MEQLKLMVLMTSPRNGSAPLRKIVVAKMGINVHLI